jgi:hypothetical protein
MAYQGRHVTRNYVGASLTSSEWKLPCFNFALGAVLTNLYVFHHGKATPTLNHFFKEPQPKT